MSRHLNTNYRHAVNFMINNPQGVTTSEVARELCLNPSDVNKMLPKIPGAYVDRWMLNPALDDGRRRWSSTRVDGKPHTLKYIPVWMYVSDAPLPDGLEVDAAIYERHFLGVTQSPSKE